jgi:transposase
MVCVQDERDQKIAELTAEVAALRAMVAELLATVADLKRQLGQNSSNSNRPPSSDAPSDRGARGGKEPSGKQRGGQPGHKGWKRTLVPPGKVNKTHDIYPERCRRRGCGRRLSQRPDANPIRHQVVEVPPIQPDVTEYRLHRVVCDCGKVTCGTLPPGVPRGMCGPRLTALIGILSGKCKMSRRDGVSFLSDLLGVKISLGALSQSEDDVSEAIAMPVEEARVYVSEQGVKNTDATGWRQGGKGRTLWTIVTPLVVFFGIAGDGSRAGLRGLFATVRGILITDRGTQFGFWAMKARQICWAHLVRRWVGFAERSGPAGQLGTDLLFWSETIFHAWHKVRDGTMTRRKFRKIMKKVRPAVERLLEQGAALGVRGVSGCCKDILEHRLALWTFIDHDGVEPTNNAAERALRAFVCWRKMCFGSQSERGNRFAARIMTVTQTLRRQQRHVLDYLTEAVQAKLVGRQAPSLLPAMATP